MKISKTTFKEAFKAAFLALLLLAGGATAYAGTWAAPTAAPTGGEPDAPIVANGDQTKYGGLIVNATKGNGSYAATGLDVVQGNVGIGIGAGTPPFPLVVSTGGDRVLNFRGDSASFGTSQAGVIIQGVNTAQNAFEPISLESSAVYLNAATQGNVGIGTASPGNELSFGTSLYTSGKKLALYENDSTGAGAYGFGITSGSLDVYSGGTYIMAIKPNAVGIGTASPARPLEVNNAMKFSNSSSDPNDGVIGANTFSPGLNIVGIYADGCCRKIKEWGSIGQMQNDGGNYFIGRSYFGDINNDLGVTPLQVYGSVNVSQTFNAAGINATGNVIANNNMQAVHFYTTSDERLKKYIQTLPDALDKVAQLRGVSFLWKDPAQGIGEQVGVIAQEVEKVYPQAVSTDPKTGIKSVAYSQLVGPLIEAVKELKSQNEVLQAKEADLESRIEALEKK